jgi:hypothetical protein
VEDAVLSDYAYAAAYGYIGIDRARVYGRLRNLLDETIIPDWGRLPQPGRTYEVGILWRLVD